MARFILLSLAIALYGQVPDYLSARNADHCEPRRNGATSVIRRGDSAIATPAPTLISDPLFNEFEISFNKAGPTLPCMCRISGYLGSTSAEEEQQLVVSVTTNSAVRSPLTYRYKVSGGKIIGEGPTVIWDFDRLAPGSYNLTVNLNDAIDQIGKNITKTVELTAGGSCDCPHACPSLAVRSNVKSVRRGDRFGFHVLALGGDPEYGNYVYQWKVQHGQIKSGQGTREISVQAAPGTAETEIEAEVEVNGTDPFANCPNVAFGSVPIGKETIGEKSGAGVLAIVLDDHRLVIGCPPGFKGCLVRSSPDMVIETLLETMRSRRDSQFRYSVTAGKIIGGGKRVKWDLSNTAPGTYQIKAIELRRGKPIGSEIFETVTIESATCICDPVCPSINVSGPKKTLGAGEDFFVTGSISGGSQDRAIMYNWIVSAGEIVSGQGSPTVKIKAPMRSADRNFTITLNIGGVDPSFNCLTHISEQFPIQP